MRVTRLELANPAPTDALVQTFPMLIREDLSKFPAGSYVLYITFHRDDGLVKRVRAGRFSVAWDMRSWEIPRREYLAEARFLLEDNGEFDRFKSLDTGEQERMLAEIWKKLDPAPETGVNESYDKFVARMAYVREHYTEDGTAVLSPRGELYLRFGAPDELVIDVIPLNRESLGEAMDMVQDKYDPVDFTNSGLTATSETDKSYERRSATNVLVDPRGLSKPREGDHVAYPYELWIYDRRGDPILPGDRSREMDVGMRYLFIDRTGHGQYELESSSAVSSK